MVDGRTYYHVWFATKRRKWLLQGDVQEYAKEALLQIAQEKGIGLLEYETVVDHVHLLLEIGPEESLGKVLNLLKGTSARKIFQQFPDLKLDAGVNHFWQKRYGAKIVEPNLLPIVSGYIRTQHERLEKFEQ
ncbi:MAG: IS200/IS605 family transposase [Chloroflexota bacterium]